MKVVVNATPLIALSLISRLELLRHLFTEVLVPPAMYGEVAIRGAGQPAAAARQRRLGSCSVSRGFANSRALAAGIGLWRAGGASSGP